MNDIFKDFNLLENREGIAIYSKAKNNNVYNKIWELQSRGLKDGTWGKSRIEKLLHFTGQKINFKDKIVLDACSGLGRFSVAAVELGAEFVCAADGSFVGPKATHDAIRNKKIPYGNSEKNYNITNLNNLENALEKICFLQSNLEDITNVLKPEQFDIIIHHMSLHHQRDYKKTLKDLTSLLKSNGVLAFNFFIDKDIPQITLDIRKVFLGKKIENVYDFLKVIGKLWNYEPKQKSLQEMLSMEDEKYSDITKGINELTEKYSIEEIEQRLHFEDCSTPYLLALDPYEIKYFIESLGLKIIYYHPSPFTFIITK